MTQLSDLAADGRLSARDLDVVMIATGRLSREAVAEYVNGTQGSPTDLPTAAVEITERICGCQHHDGGATELVSVDADSVHLRVAGTCVRCPQIIYTMDVLRRALRYRAPHAKEILIDGADLANGARRPAGSQLTMAMVMRRFGLTFEDLDRELERKPTLTDDDLVRLAQRCAIRQELTSHPTPRH